MVKPRELSSIQIRKARNGYFVTVGDSGGMVEFSTYVFESLESLQTWLSENFSNN